MKIKLNISTCPNDTYMFHALLHGLVDTCGFEFDVTLSDIEELNQRVIEGEPHVSKISCAIVPQIADRYRVLNSGSALGRGNGPIVVSRHKLYAEELSDAVVAVPGCHTTANKLITTLFNPKQVRYYLFHEIQQAVMDGECDAGVLIHEERFTYQSFGLDFVADLGVEWERRTALPLPLGAIVVTNELDLATQQQLDQMVRRSIEYANRNPHASRQFIKKYARNLTDDVIDSHIKLFVNEFSVALGDEGRQALCRLIETPETKYKPENLFVDEQHL